MKSYKTVKGALKHLAEVAKGQEMSMCSDWDKLTDDQQHLFYGLLAGIQNDLGDISRSLHETGFLKEPIW